MDLRSDTVTRPTPEMRRAMAEAEVGDDVYGEDPTVNRLQERAAEIFGREAGAVRSHRLDGQSDCDQDLDASWQRSDLRRARPHQPITRWPPCPRLPAACRALRYVDDGILTWKRIEPLIRPKIYYRSQTALICLESSHNMAGGTVYPPEVSDEICDRAHAAGIPRASGWSAHIQCGRGAGQSVAEITRKFDSVMFCLSKGLGAPVGSMMVGSRRIHREGARLPQDVRRRHAPGRHTRGGGIVALEKSPARLHEDHANARYLAEGLARIPGVSVDLTKVQTNIVFFDVRGTGRTAADDLRRVRQARNPGQSHRSLTPSACSPTAT